MQWFHQCHINIANNVTTAGSVGGRAPYGVNELTGKYTSYNLCIQTYYIPTHLNSFKIL